MFMKSKKAAFLFFYTLIVLVIMVYSIIVFFGDRPGVDENAQLGQMVFDIYGASIESDKHLFFIHKVGEYSLMSAMKETMSEGLDGEGCMVEGEFILYKDVKCNFYPEEFTISFSENVGNSFDKYSTNISSENYTFETRYDGTSIFLTGTSGTKLNFADEDHFNFSRNMDLEVVIDYDFSWFSEMEYALKSNLICLENSRDEQKLENIAGEESRRDPSDCLREYPQFSEVRKSDGILYYDYLADGYLFEEWFDMPLALDLNGFKAAISIK